jgi:hypothetical protein
MQQDNVAYCMTMNDSRENPNQTYYIALFHVPGPRSNLVGLVEIPSYHTKGTANPFTISPMHHTEYHEHGRVKVASKGTGMGRWSAFRKQPKPPKSYKTLELEPKCPRTGTKMPPKFGARTRTKVNCSVRAARPVFFRPKARRRGKP